MWTIAGFVGVAGMLEKGGAVYIAGGEAAFYSCSFSGNEAVRRAGGELWMVRRLRTLPCANSCVSWCLLLSFSQGLVVVPHAAVADHSVDVAVLVWCNECWHAAVGMVTAPGWAGHVMWADHALWTISW